MPSEKDKNLEFDQYLISNQITYIIYSEIEFLIRNIDRCANSPENSSAAEINEHVPCGYSM